MVITLFVVVHENLFQGRLFNRHVRDRYSTDLVHDRIDVALEEEADGAVVLLEIGHPGNVKIGGIDIPGHHPDLLIVVLLQGADICNLDDPALPDDRHPVAHPLHLAQDV